MTRKENDELKRRRKRYIKTFEKALTSMLSIIVLISILIGGYLGYKEEKPTLLTQQEIDEMINIAKDVNSNGLESILERTKNKYLITIGDKITVETTEPTKGKLLINFINDEIDYEIVYQHQGYVVISTLGYATVGGILAFVFGFIIVCFIACIFDRTVKGAYFA